jgi:hypothetical protein
MATLLIVGAGFSAPAGFPLGSQLFPIITRLAERTALLAEQLREDSDRYLRYLHHTTGENLGRDSVNFEEYMAFLDIEHSLGLLGSDTWTAEGNRAQMIIRNIIALALHDCLLAATPAQRSPYKTLVSRLHPGDLVISFNYDTLLESVLDELQVPYRLFPDRLVSVSEWGGVLKLPEEEVVLLKVHGSIDWFDRTAFDSTDAAWRRAGANDRPYDPVFTDPQRCQVEPLITGPYPPDSPLLSLTRARNLAPYLSESQFLLQAPFLVAPSAYKTLYLNRLIEFWNGIARVGAGFTRMAIIGFSLPLHDHYVRQPVYDLVRNYQSSDTTILGNKKADLLMVDLRGDEDTQHSYRETYRFVDWARARADFSGFSGKAVESLFS